MKKRFLTRSVVTGLCVTLLILAGCSSTSENVSQSRSEVHKGGDLYVQSAPSISLADGKLRLIKADEVTLFFTDQPRREAGYMKTKAFVEWRQMGAVSPTSNAAYRASVNGILVRWMI